MRTLVVIGALLLSLASTAFAADVTKMVDANFLLGQDNKAFCSATLIHARLALTNYHCVEQAISNVEREETQLDGTVKKVIRTIFAPMVVWQHSYGHGGIAGRTELRAEIQVVSRQKDLAVLMIVAENAKLGAPAPLPPDGYALSLGQEVYAVGNPALLENTLTRGILSHLNREMQWDSDQVAKYIQTDAAIAGGSSGGALYSLEGYLIGVPAAGYRGAALSFAIPFSEIKAFLAANGYTFVWDPKAPSREAWLEQQKAKK